MLFSNKRFADWTKLSSGKRRGAIAKHTIKNKNE